MTHPVDDKRVEELRDKCAEIAKQPSFMERMTDAACFAAICAELLAARVKLREVEGLEVSVEIVIAAAESYLMQVGYRNCGRTTEAIANLRAVLARFNGSGE